MTLTNKKEKVAAHEEAAVAEATLALAAVEVWAT